MRHYKFIIPVIVALSTIISCGSHQAPLAETGKKGIFHLTGWKPGQGMVSLSGEWSFYDSSFIDPGLFNASTYKPSEKALYKELPAEWNSYKKHDGDSVGYGYGTYVLKLRDLTIDSELGFYTREQGTAYTLYYCDSAMTVQNCRIPIIKNGVPGKNKESTIPQLLPMHGGFKAKSSEGNVIVHVANFHHRQGGLWENIYIGSLPTLIIDHEYSKALGYISLGIILVMGIYHLGLFSQRKEDHGSLFFGLFCLDLTARIIATERVLQSMFPVATSLQFEIFYKFEYATFYLGTALFSQFFYEVFNKFISKKFVITVWIVTLLFLAQLIFPVSFYSKTVTFFQVFTMGSFLYAIVSLSRAWIKNISGSAISLFGFIMLFITFLNDILYSSGLLPTTYLLQYGFLFFIFSQSMILSTRFSLAFRESESLRQSHARFVPTQFVSFLDKTSITDVNAGDSVKKDLAVLFLDIRGFTSISEKMTTEENFKFLNSFLKRMSPHIHEAGGFVDKFIGDAIMALFPDSPENAVRAAIDMQKELVSYNNHRQSNGYPSIKVGIGVHTGELMLGTVGTSDRLDTTVIGDTVNLASRLENLTKEYNCSIIISEQVFKALPANTMMIREIDTVRVKGKTSSVRIYEVFDSDAPAIIDIKKKTMGTMKQGMELYRLGQYEEAIVFFNRCLDELNNDPIALYYRDLCKRNHRKSTAGPRTEGLRISEST